MKSTWFGCRRRCDFAKLIAEAGGHVLQPYDTFGAFLTCAAGSLRQSVNRLRAGQIDDDLEQKVIKEQKRMKRPEKLAEALGCLANALEHDAYDFLGSTLTELGMADSRWRGQCFTPRDLCLMMAQMQFQDAKPDPGHRISISEPACGGGAMTIAVSEVLKQNGFFPWHYWVHAVDVDWKCFAMTYIQLTLLGVPATVTHGNTLTLETWEHADTFALAMHPFRQRSESAEPAAEEHGEIAVQPDETASDGPEPLPSHVGDAIAHKELVQMELF